MKKIAAIAFILSLGTNLALAQANPNQGATTGSEANREQMQQSTPGNPNNPGPREYISLDQILRRLGIESPVPKNRYDR